MTHKGAYIVHSLPAENVMINIFSFGSKFSSLWEVPMQYNEETRQQLINHIDEMTANYGGTEILDPLKGLKYY